MAKKRLQKKRSSSTVRKQESEILQVTTSKTEPVRVETSKVEPVKVENFQSTNLVKGRNFQSRT